MGRSCSHGPSLRHSTSATRPYRQKSRLVTRSPALNARDCGVAGERLGYSGIKVALPTQITTEEAYLSLYIRSILAMQTRALAVSGKEVKLQLAIMVSDDTASRTDELLKANDYFGLSADQVTALTPHAACRIPISTSQYI